MKTIHGGEQIVIATRKGYAIRFPETEVRSMGRSTRGVKAMTFREADDCIVGMEVFTKLGPVPEGTIIPGGEPGSEPVVELSMPAAPTSAPEIGENGEVVPAEERAAYEGMLLTVAEMGFGKRTDINEYRVTHRGGKGVGNLDVTQKTGVVLAIKRMLEGDELMIVTTSGKVIRMNADTVRSTGRIAQGVKLMTIDEGDRLISVVRIPAREEVVE